MKKLSLILIGLLFVPSLFLTSCDRGDDIVEGGGETQTSYEILSEYMVDNHFDISKIIKNDADQKFVVGAPALTDYDADAFKAKYYIMDIRSGEKFNEGHIDGAKNVAFANILTEAQNAGSKQILMVCYTGQTACYATALLRLAGYTDAVALKWGMTGWSANTDSWTSNTGDVGVDSNNWSFSQTAPSVNIYDAPSISSTSIDGATILQQRIEEVIAEGFKGVNNTDVVASPGDYFINNYFSETDYEAFGHIDGAYRISPLTVAGGETLNLNPDAKVVTYCYTGQTSAVITACLRVLGYDAYSLKFGMNGLNHSSSAWSSNQWGVDSKTKGLPLVQ